MSSNDLTDNVANDATTKPTIETVLERINQISESLTLRMNDIVQRMDDSQKQIADGFAKLASEINSLRTDMRKIERRIEILNDNILNVQADHRDLLVRVENLEKAS